MFVILLKNHHSVNRYHDITKVDFKLRWKKNNVVVITCILKTQRQRLFVSVSQGLDIIIAVQCVFTMYFTIAFDRLLIGNKTRGHLGNNAYLTLFTVLSKFVHTRYL